MKLQHDLLFNSDWNVLVIIDCCRYDIFKELIMEYPDLRGNIIPVDSECYNTQQWYRHHWMPSAPIDDILIVSAHPSIYRKVHRFDLFFGRAEMLKFAMSRAEADDYSWMEPDNTFSVLKNIDTDSKKLLIHILPPHLPYIGKRGREFLKSLRWKKGHFVTIDIYEAVSEYALKNGWDEVRSYYVENLKVSLDSISRYVKKLKEYGTVVLSADHGEIIGPDTYKHGLSNYSELREVPWHELEK